MAHKAYILRRLKYKFGGYRKKKRIYKTHFKNYFILVYISIFIFITLFSLVCGGRRLFSLSLRVSEDLVENDILKQCSILTSDILSEYGISYSSLINSSVDESGKINSLNTDFTKVNVIKNTLEQRLSEYLREYNTIQCRIPIGAVFSDDLFYAYGPKIPVNVLTSADTSIEFCDTFDSGGVNQTKHTLILKVTVNANLHTVLNSSEFQIKTDIPIAETVIVGDVPSIMLK